MPSENDETLRVVYEQLNEQVRSREASLTTILSILLPASLILATLSFDPGVKEAGKRLPIFGTAALPGAAILISVLGLVYWITGEEVDKVFWKHIHNLEDQLGIIEGHKTIGDELKRKRLYRVRRWFFPIVFLVALASYAWLFYNSF